MQSNGLQEAIEEIDQAINHETATRQAFADDKDVVDDCDRRLATLRINKARFQRAAKGLPIEEEILQKDLTSNMMPSFIKDIWRRVYLAVTFRAKMEPPVDLFQPTGVAEVKEVGYFVTKNDIMEGAWEAPKIEASNWKHVDRYVWPVEQPYKGFMIQAENNEDFIAKCSEVDKNISENRGIPYYRIEDFQAKFYPAPVLDEPVEQFENDIEFLVQKQMPEPNREKSKTVNL